jgi:hypothetical protein
MRLIAVVPPTPTSTRARRRRRSLPLLLEKPAARNPPPAGHAHALRERPIPVMVAQTLRTTPPSAPCWRGPRIGPVHSPTFTQRFEPSPLDWLDDPVVSGGG